MLDARDVNGTNTVYPAIEMEFAESNLVWVPYISGSYRWETEQKAQQIALQCAEAFDSAGLFAVEFSCRTRDVLYVK